MAYDKYQKEKKIALVAIKLIFFATKLICFNSSQDTHLFILLEKKKTSIHKRNSDYQLFHLSDKIYSPLLMYLLATLN